MATPTSLPATFTSGQVLTAAQMNDLRGAFRILQLVRATDATQRTTTSTSFVDASISVTITPTSTDSDILLLWVFNHDVANTGGTHTRAQYQITDNSNVAISGAEGMLNGVLLSTVRTQHGQTVIGYDSPATTSATTYKGRFRAYEASQTATINNQLNTGQLFALEISA